jgi:hypothetical protein
MRSIRTIQTIALGMAFIQTLVALYLLFALPSIPTLYADESWVTDQIKKYEERGILEKLIIDSARSNSIMEKHAILYLIGVTGVSIFSILGSCVTYYLARRVQCDKSVDAIERPTKA